MTANRRVFGTILASIAIGVWLGGGVRQAAPQIWASVFWGQKEKFGLRDFQTFSLVSRNYNIAKKSITILVINVQ